MKLNKIFIFIILAIFSLCGAFAVDYDNIAFTNEEFYNGAVTATKTIELSTGKSALGYIRSGASYVKICDLDGTNCGSENLGISATSIDMFEDTTNNKIIFIDGLSPSGIYYVLNLDGSVSSGGHTFNTGATNYVSAVQTSSTEFAIAYQDTADGSKEKLIICKLDGSSCGSENQILSVTSSYNKIIKSSDNKLRTLIVRSDSSPNLRVVNSELDGTFISEYAVNSGATSHVDMIEGSDNKLKIVYRDGGNSNYGTLISCNLDGNNCGSEVVFQSNSVEYNSIIEYSNRLFVAYMNFGIPYSGSLINMNLDGTDVSTYSEYHSGGTVSHNDLILTSNNQLVISYNDDSNSKGMFAISEVLTSTVLGNRSIEQSYADLQTSTIVLTNTNYTTILAGTFNISQDNVNNYGSSTLQIFSDSINNITCRTNLDGVNGTEITRNNFIVNTTTSMNIFRGNKTINSGLHTIVMECKKTGLGNVTIGRAVGVGHILSSNNNNTINYDNAAGSKTIVNDYFYNDIESFNFTTEDIHDGLNKTVVIDWGSSIAYNGGTTLTSSSRIRVYNGEDIVKTCQQIENEMPVNNVMDIGSGCFFYATANTTYTIKYEGTGYVDGNVTYNYNINVKEFNLKQEEIKSVFLNNQNIVATNFTEISSVNLVNEIEDAVLYVKAIALARPQDSQPDTTIHYKLVIEGDVTYESQDISHTISNDFKNNFISEGTIPIPVGKINVSLLAYSEDGSCILNYGELLTYIAQSTLLTQKEFNINSYNDWNESSILNFNVYTSNANYGTTNGTITIPTELDFIGFSVNSPSYVSKYTNNHDTTTNANVSLYQSEVKITSRDDVNPFIISNFNITTNQKGVLETTNGEIILYPNLGTYNWNFSSSYFDRNNILFNITSSAQEINVDPYRILITFTNTLNNNPITGINFTDINFSKSYNTGSDSTLLLFHDIGTYDYSAFRNLYTVMNGTYTISDLYNTYTISLDPIFNLTLKDEKTLGILNISAISNIELRVTCADDSEVRYTVNTTNIEVPITCEYRKFKFIVEQSGETYYRTLNLDENNLNFDVYLLNIDNTVIIFNSFNLYDLLGTYDNPRLSINKYIGNELVQITGDFADIQGLVSAYLIFGDEYVFIINSDNLPERNIGFYSADTAGEKTLRLFDLDFVIDQDVKYGDVIVYNNINNSILYTQYKDTSSSTNLVQYTIRNNNIYGDILYQSTSTSNEVIFSYSIPQQYENSTLHVSLSYDNSYGTENRVYRLKQNNNLSIGIDWVFLDMNWTVTIFLGFFALILTISTANVGSIILLALASFLAKIGWFQVSWTAISLGIVVALISILKEKDKE